jgi:4-hydroxy-tetrahydrodipicolinate synthase
MFKPTGIYPAMTTPFTESGEINEKVLRAIVDFNINKGLHGLFPVSSSGDFACMTLEQMMECMTIVAHQANKRVPVIPGISSTSLEVSVRLAHKAKEVGCDAVLACPPYYYKMSPASMAKYYETLANEIQIPLIIYNIPVFAPPIPYEVVTLLADHKNIIGMKDSSGNIVDFMHFKKAAPRFSWLTGREEGLTAALAVGADGCMTAMANIFPELMVGIYNACRADDFEKARYLQQYTLPIISACFGVPFPVPFRIAMEARGFKMGPHKQIMCESELRMVQKITPVVHEIVNQVVTVIKQEKLDE